MARKKQQKRRSQQRQRRQQRSRQAYKEATWGKAFSGFLGGAGLSLTMGWWGWPATLLGATAMSAAKDPAYRSIGNGMLAGVATTGLLSIGTAVLLGTVIATDPLGLLDTFTRNTGGVSLDSDLDQPALPYSQDPRWI